MARNAGSLPAGLTDSDSERAMLSIVLCSKGAALDNPELLPELFFTPANLTLFLACSELHKKGVVPDFFGLTQLLNERQQLAGIGGPSALVELQIYPPGSSDHFLGLLKKCHAKRALRLLVQDASNQLERGFDVEEMVRDMGIGLASLDPSSTGDDVKDKSIELARARIRQIEEGKTIAGMPTGIAVWDKAFGGIVPGMYIGLAARPMFGKSAMLEQAATTLLRRDEPVCIFAQDMAPDQMIMRMACRVAQVPKWNLDHGKVDKEELAEVKEILTALEKAPLRLHSVQRLDAERMVAIARRDRRKYGCRSFWLDHIQTLAIPAKEEPRIAFGRASKLFREFVNKEQVSLVCLAHLNREAAKSGARVDQVKEFDDMLGDVDGMAMLDSKIDPSTLAAGADWPMQFVVGKNRNGPSVRWDVLFNRRYMLFEEMPFQPFPVSRKK